MSSSKKSSRRFRLLTAAVLWLATTAAALAQQYMPLAPRSVVGNLGFQSNSGSTITFEQLGANLYGPVPASTVFAGAAAGGAGLPTFRPLVTSDIPVLSSNFANITGTLSAAQAATVAPTVPVAHPSSGNLVCSQGHFLAWMDQNICSSADNWILNSTDPSALMQLTMGGTISNGDIVTLTFTFAGPCSGGCAVNTGALNSGTDTTTTIASKLAAAIQANSNIYNNVAGVQGQVLYVTSSANVLNFDYDSRTGMKLVASVAGIATETVTFPANSSCGTACNVGWDVNPTDIRGRLPGGGIAPIANLGLGIASQLYGLVVQSSDSATPNAYSVQYGTLANFVQNSTHGAVQSRWFLGVPSLAGAPGAIGIWVGQHLGAVQDALPTLTGTCGSSPSVLAGSTDNAGTINLGTGSPTACNLVFAHAYSSTPSCTVTRQSGNAGLAYTLATNQLSTAGGAASDKINYVCMGQ